MREDRQFILMTPGPLTRSLAQTRDCRDERVAQPKPCGVSGLFLGLSRRFVTGEGLKLGADCCPAVSTSGSKPLGEQRERLDVTTPNCGEVPTVERGDLGDAQTLGRAR